MGRARWGFAMRSLLLALTLAACAQAPEGHETGGPGTIAFAHEVGPDEAGATRYEEYGEELWLSEQRPFTVKTAFLTHDHRGRAAIGFELVEKEQFRAYTGSIVGKRMGIFVDGEFLSAPEVGSPLPGGGVLTGGLDGFTEEEARALVARLRGEDEG